MVAINLRDCMQGWLQCFALKESMVAINSATVNCIIFETCIMQVAMRLYIYQRNPKWDQVAACPRYRRPEKNVVCMCY